MRTAGRAVLTVTLLMAAAGCGGGDSSAGGNSTGSAGAQSGGGSLPASNVLYVAADRFVEVIDLSTNTVVKTIDGYSVSPAGIESIAASATAKQIYVSWLGGPVATIDATSGSIGGSTAAASPVGDLYVNAAGTMAYAADVAGPIDILTFGPGVSLGGTLSSGYVLTNSTATSVLTGASAIDQGRNRLYVVVSDGPTDSFRIDAWDLGTKAVLYSAAASYSAYDVALDPTRGVLWFSSATALNAMGVSDNAIVAVNAADLQVLHTVDLGFAHGGGFTGNIAVNTATNLVYYLDCQYGTVYVVDGGTGNVAGHFALGVPTADEIVVNANTNTAYVSSGSSVLVVDLSTQTVKANISLPQAANRGHTMAVLP